MKDRKERGLSPITGDGFGGVEMHEGVEDAQNRLDWLRANEKEIVRDSGRESYEVSLADAERELAQRKEAQL